MVVIIDYDAGNIRSVEKALEHLGKDHILSRDINEILKADHVILPGVGSFGDAMDRLNEYGLTDAVKETVKRQIPFLGICLGLQLLFEESEESPGISGLGIFKGKIKKLPGDSGLKVPDIGWNSLDIKKSDSILFKGLSQSPFMYFVHSYYADAQDKNIVSAQIEYGVTADVAIESGNIYACQFHPEKSSAEGLQVLKNFLDR